MKSPNIRQNFYQGQNILAKDLNALQDYSDTNKNLLVSELLGSGILHGFEITKKEGFTISISPGVAFDKNGTRLILEELTDITLTPPTATDEESKPILLGIKLSYRGSEPIKDSVDKETPTRFTPSVEIITGENLDEEVFQLASITLDESAITAITTIKNKFSYPLLYPIGYQYTQYPNDTTGRFDETESPTSLFGGDWEKQFETESVFFRTEGTLANESRSAGLQSDAMQNHVHDTILGSHGHSQSVGFSAELAGRNGYERSTGSGGTVYINNTNLGTKRSNNPLNARTSTENRSRNRLMIIWKRIG